VARAISSAIVHVDAHTVGRANVSDDEDRDLSERAEHGDDNPPPLVKLTPAEPPPPEVPVQFARIVGVRFRAAGPIVELDCGDKSYAKDEWILADSERGARLGKVVIASIKTYVMGPLRRVLRKARPDELGGQGEASRVELEAYRFCKERLRERKLAMKLVQAEVTPGQKATFYFASEERVDFRELVRDLAQRFHLRIEMRQIGARDGAKAVGGIGSCGRELCCTTFLPAFQPVSIRMAKDQGMVLNPSKLAGQCGRLKCCLVYEHQTYKEMGKGLPKVGKKVITPVGPGRVLDLDILGQMVRVLLEEGGAQTFAAAEVRAMHAPTVAGREGPPGSGMTPEPPETPETPETVDGPDSPEPSDPELSSLKPKDDDGDDDPLADDSAAAAAPEAPA
jgi:cell fate regulator YaaT (PSP1 superfamily)